MAWVKSFRDTVWNIMNFPAYAELTRKLCYLLLLIYTPLPFFIPFMLHFTFFACVLEKLFPLQYVSYMRFLH